MPPKTNGSFDSDKEFLMRLVFNAKIPITEACKEVAEQTGEKAETLRERKTGWEKDVAKMLGGSFTPSGVYQRFYKLKKEADALVKKSTGDGAGPATPTTPSGASKSATKPKASAKSTGKGKKRKNDDEDEVDENLEADKTPSKKVKKENKIETVVKEASEDEEV